MAFGVAASAFVLLPLLAPIVAGNPLHGDDLGRFHLPTRAFYARCLAEGDSPLWHPGLYCGFYLHGEGQAGMDHPLHRLLYGWLPLRSAFAIEVGIGYPAALLGMVLWLRRAGLPSDAAVFGGMTFALSEAFLLRYVHVNAIAVLAHLPWVLLAIEGFRSQPSRSGVAAALLTASQGLLGYPQYWAFSLIVSGTYAWSRLGPSRDLLRLGGWLALGIVMASAQVLPHLEALAASTRSRPDSAFLGMNSLHPLNLAATLAPTAFRRGFYNPDGAASWPRHESVGNLGVVVPACLAWAWMRRNSLGRWRPIATWAAVVMAVALVLSLGRYSPLFPIYVRLPGACVFRGPARWMHVAQIGAAVLAAVAFADAASLGGQDRKPSRRTLAPLLLPVILSMVTVLALASLSTARSPGWRGEQLSAPSVLVASVPMIAAPCGLLALAARGRRLALVFLPVAIGLDEARSAVAPILRHEGRPAMTNAPPPPDVGTSRLVGSMNDGLADSTRLVSGYVALTPRRSLDYTRPKALRIAGAAWVRRESGDWDRLDAEPLPRVRLVGRLCFSGDPRADLERIDPETKALVEAPRLLEVDSPIRFEEQAPGRADLTRDRPGAIDIRTHATGMSILVTSESYHAGWRATIDGVPAEVLRVNGDFLGCRVRAGDHAVSLRFDPAGARWGRRISALGLAACGIALLATWRRRAIPATIVLDSAVRMR